MSTILVWYPHGDNVGHVSLRVSPTLYVSFWPKDPNAAAVLLVPSTGRSYEQDRHLEGGTDSQGNAVPRNPDESIFITSKLDEGGIRSWWAEYQYSGYSLAARNCIHAVKAALTEGAIGFFENITIQAKLEAISAYLWTVGALTKGGSKSKSKK